MGKCREGKLPRPPTLITTLQSNHLYAKTTDGTDERKLFLLTSWTQSMNPIDKSFGCDLSLVSFWALQLAKTMITAEKTTSRSAKMMARNLTFIVSRIWYARWVLDYNFHPLFSSRERYNIKFIC
ncbi:hypothetical protein LINPERPRIM_LOCUS40680 [Linum perenne]